MFAAYSFHRLSIIIIMMIIIILFKIDNKNMHIMCINKI